MEKIEILLEPTTFENILEIHSDQCVSDKSVMYHLDDNNYVKFSAHLELTIQNLVIRMRAYDITELQYLSLIEYQFREA